MKTYTQTKNKFVLSIMFMAFVLFAVSGIFLLRHNTTSVRADGEQNFTYTYGNETTVKDNVTYSWSILDAQNRTAKLYKVTMEEGASSNLVLPSKINRVGEETPYTFVEMYSNSVNNQNGVFYPSKDKITSIAFADDNQIANIGANAFAGCTNLTNVTIPSTITNIGVNAFAGCTSIQTISYNANLTNSFTLGNGIFAGSGNALNLNILSNVTSIPAYAFSGMANITNLVFHKDTQVTSFGEGAFMNANLKNVTIPATVNSIGKWAFAGNPQLALTVANGNRNFAVSDSCLYKLTDSKKTTLLAIPSSATSIAIDADCTEIDAEIFYGCTELTNITGNANFAFENNCLYKLVDGKKQILVYVTANATEFTPNAECTEYATNAFINATNLEKLKITTNVNDNEYKGISTITDIVISKDVTSIGQSAFQDCVSLKTVTIEEESNLTTIGRAAFYGCTNLKEITIPSKVTSIGSHAFFNCNKLSTVNYNATQAELNSTDVAISRVFEKAGSNTPDGLTFNVGANVTHIPAGLFTVYNYSDSPKLTTINFAEGSQLTTIGDDAFYMVTSLTKIDFPASLTTIGEQSFEGAGITSAVFPANVTSIGNKAFYLCNDLTKVEFTYTEGSNNITIGNQAFMGTGVQELTLSNKVTSIGAEAFRNCGNLAKVVFTNASMSDPQVTIGADAFKDNNKDVKYYFYDHKYTPSDTIFSNTTNNNIYVIKIYNGEELVKTYNAPAGEVITLPTKDEIKKEGYGLVGWSTLTDADSGIFEYTVVAETDEVKNILYAVWQERFTLTFDMQEGTGGTESVEATFNLAVPTITLPTREGYRFGGYYTEANAQGIKYYNADGSSARKWDIYLNSTLYANWIKLYNITLNKNNGTGGTDKITYAIDDVLANIEVPTRTGYTFLGFYNGETQIFDATGAVVADIIKADADDRDNGTAFTFQNSEVTELTAKWQAIEYTIQYNSNKPTNSPFNVEGTTANSTHNYDVDKNLTTNGYSLKGYTFKGWSKTQDGSVEFTNAQSIKNLTADAGQTVTLYAVWEVNNYTINFASGTGYTISAKLNGTDFASGSTITINDSLVFTITAAKGYTAGNLTVNGTDGTYTFDANTLTKVFGNVTISGSATINNYTITFESGEGYTITAKLNGADFTSGSTITINDSLVFTITAANGYTAGDLVANGTENTYTFDANTLSAVSGDITIAGSATTNEYTITITNGEGYTISATKNGNALAENEKFTVKDELVLTITASTGYTAGAISVSADVNGTFTRTDNTITNAYSNLTITSSATLNNYTVTFTNGEGYTITATKDGNAFASGSAITIKDTITFAIQSKTGYNTGVLSVIGAQGTYTFEDNILSNVSSNVEITGEVVAAQYTITIENGTGYTITATLNDAPFTSGSTLTIADTLKLTITASTGYTAGNITVSGTDADRTFDGANLSKVNTNLTITGEATANTYNIVYNSNKPTNASGEVTGNMSATNMTYNTPANLSDNAFMLTGYTFNGWATSESGVVVYSNKEEVNNLTTTNNDTINLYAVWTPITYKVEYHKVKPALASTEISGETLANEGLTYDQTFTLRACNFTLTGYKFVGWSLTENGEIAYTDEQTLSNLTDTNDDIVELYSVFTPITYTIKFNTQKPTGATDDVKGTMTDYIASFDSAITLPACEYTLRGYKFIGWATISNGAVVYTNTQQIDTNLSDTQDAIINLYTVWEIETYTITYADSNTCEIVIETQQGAAFASGRTLEVGNVVYIVLTPKAGYSLAQGTQSIIINAPADKYQLEQKSGSTNKFILQNVAQDLDIQVVAFANTDTPYTVEHYQQNLNVVEGAGDANYTLIEIDANTEDTTGTTDALTEAVAKSYIGFEVKAFEQININGDGSTIVKLYYDRIIYTVTFVVDDTKGNTTDELVYNLPYGATVTPPTITSTHYEFLNWDPVIKTEVKVEDNATYTAIFTPKLYKVYLAINDTTAGAIQGGHSEVNNVPYGTKITALGNVLTFHIEGAPVTINGVPTATEPGSATQYRLLNWFYSGITAITNNGVYLDVDEVTITAQFEKRIIYITDTAGQLDLSDSIGVAENSDAKFEKVNNDNVNTLISIPAGKRAMQAYNINIYEKDGNTLTDVVVPTTGEILIKLNVTENILLANGLQVLILDETSGTVITRDATITGNQLVFSTPCLGQMLIVADMPATFPWWIIVLVVVVVLIVVAVLYWLLVLRPQEKVENDSNANEDYDSVLTGLAEDKRQKDATNAPVEAPAKAKKVTKTETKTTKTPEEKKDK